MRQFQKIPPDRIETIQSVPSHPSHHLCCYQKRIQKKIVSSIHCFTAIQLREVLNLHITTTKKKKRKQKAAGASTSVHSNVIVSSCAPKTKLKHRFDIHFITKQQEYKAKKRIDVTIETNEASLNKRKQNK